MPSSNATLQRLNWLLFGLTALFIVVWRAPGFYSVEGLASYLPLHIFAETFSIIVSMMVFGVAWNVYSAERPSNIVILSCALLAVGLIDFAHMLSFKGMPDFITPSGPEKAINFWLSARLIAALALLVMALRTWQPLLNPINRFWLLAGSLVVSSVVIWLGLAYPQLWPRTFIAGQGLTPFKIGAEYAIIAILLIPAVRFYSQSKRPQTFDAASLFAASVITILSELSFTLYSDVSDVFNLLGHLYKIVAYVFIYRAVFIGSVREPYWRLDAEFAENQRITKELRTASLYTRSLIEASLDPLVTISTEGTITDVNRATELATGRSRSELIGTDFSDYFTEPDKAREGYQQVFQKGAVIDYPLALRHRDGRVTEVLYNASVYRNEAGEVSGVFAAARDITERNASQAIRTQLAAIVEFSNDAIIGKTPEGIITSWNKGAERIYGYSSDEIIGRHITLLAQSSLHAEVHDLLHKVRAGEIVANFESERVRKDGSQLHVSLTLSPIRNAAGEITGISTIARDITERKLGELRLRESEQAFRTLAENSPDVIVRYDRECRRIYVNPEFERVNHLTARQVFGKRPVELSTELKPLASEFTEKLAAAMASGVADKVDLEISKNGMPTYWFVRVVPEFDATGAVTSALTIWSDITERKRTEIALQEQEKNTQSLLRLARKLERAQVYSEVLNAALDEVKNIIGYQSLWIYLLSEDKKYFKALIAGGTESDTVMSEVGTAKLIIEGDPMLEEIAKAKEIVVVEDALTDARTDKEIVARLGSRTIVNVPIVLFDRHLGTIGMGSFGEEGVRVPTSAEQKYLISLASHMAAALDRIYLQTERKRAEKELRELNNDFVTLLESTGDYIYFKDHDSRFRFCSQTLARVTGHQSWRDMRGKNDFEVFPKQTAQIYYEEELPIFQEGKALLNKTDPYFDEQGVQRWVNTNKWPVFDDSKKTVVGVFGMSRDITELKEAEDKIVELNRDLERRVGERTAQLEEANKELESFSYSVSHDLRTPLRAIDGFSHILLDDYAGKLDDEGKRLLKVVRDNTGRMGQLIDDILQFSRTGRVDLTFAEIDMEKLIRDVVEELQQVLAHGKLQVEIGPLPKTMGDRAMMRHVFANLISNAIKFTRRNDNPTIQAGAFCDENETVYYVKDNGVGFDMQYADKLFGVFQRLHSMEEFEGTGIGLAIVKRIITRHGGRVWAEGKVQQGATIYFALPVGENKHEQ